MKVYFMATPRGKDELVDNYRAIYEMIQKLGLEHTTDFVMRVDVDRFYFSDIRSFYKSTITNLKKADICIFETSIHSLAIGQLINEAVEQNKPVIALYTKGNVPFFLSGSHEEKVQIIQYDLDNLKKILEQAVEYASESADSRFNFFISRKLASYLDWISKKRRIPRAVYLRQLIIREMRKHREFSH